MVNRRRVVVTGMGAVTGFGVGVEPLVEGIFAGRSCVRRVAFDASMMPCQIGAEAPEFDASPYFKHAKDGKRYDGVVTQAGVAARLAVDDAQFVIAPEDAPRSGAYSAPRVGTYVGSGVGGLDSFEENVERGASKGYDRLLPLFIPNAITNLSAGVISIETGAMGPGFALVSACATSGHAIGEAARLIQLGICDAMIAGGTERALNLTGLGGFSAMKAITFDFNDAPEKGSRPFDAKRSGFVMGEGAGILILEEAEMALARGAKIYAEVIGYGASSDAFHITAPSPEGYGAQLAMRAALASAGLEPQAVGYVNAHGTSTPLNDANETKAIKHVFGPHAQKLLVSSTKSMHGHLLGAAAVVESIACIEALRRGQAPPTINQEFPDPECDLNYVPNRAQDWNGDVAMCNTFGFGGQNAVLIFRRWQG
jgi:3-oxoacyl-[acyl-carrier-protein] synthase II